jgi:DNA-binding IclR family transcriptional regulator
MADVSAGLLRTVTEIRDLLLLVAEPAIAERDQKLRSEVRSIVGASQLTAIAVLLMDGTRNQTAIHKESGMNKGNLSKLVKQLSEAKLLSSNEKEPKLALVLPSHFFENGASNGR